MKKQIPGIQRITIIGLGLIGGSLAMALKKTGKYHVIGFSKRKETVRKAIKIKIVDEAHFSVKHATKKADIVFFCVPISEMKSTFVKIAPHLKPGCIVTDVGSTKVQIVKWASETLPKDIIFIGGHPMAGSEKSGIENIKEDLFIGKSWCFIPNKPKDSSGCGEAVTLTPPRWRNQTSAVKKLTQIIKSIGANPVFMSETEHDKSVALISHLPFIISTALMQTAVTSQNWKSAQKLASTGFASMTRLANGNTQMHRDIYTTNKSNIDTVLQTFTETLSLYRKNTV